MAEKFSGLFGERTTVTVSDLATKGCYVNDQTR